jgi:hypothetical protein
MPRKFPQPTSYRQGVGSYDDKKGLGYSPVEPSGRFEPRQLQGDFPYRDADDYADLDDEELALDPDELDAFVTAVNMGYNPVDYLSAAGNDPFYFVAGNTKLSELGISHGISPMPDLYKKRHASAGGGAVPATIHQPTFRSRSSTQPSGTKHGFSRAPKPIDIVEPEPAYSLDDIPSDDERTLIKLKKLIAAIHDQESSEVTNSG